ncbi:hypothetical protein C8Q70DRAFT_99410 [Cubamyces menziesii]|nr:hypothetical protein C8Q70DRAFT_99410 [Cubamyces menziesii]
MSAIAACLGGTMKIVDRTTLRNLKCQCCKKNHQRCDDVKPCKRCCKKAVACLDGRRCSGQFSPYQGRPTMTRLNSGAQDEVDGMPSPVHPCWGPLQLQACTMPQTAVPQSPTSIQTASACTMPSSSMQAPIGSGQSTLNSDRAIRTSVAVRSRQTAFTTDTSTLQRILTCSLLVSTSVLFSNRLSPSKGSRPSNITSGIILSQTMAGHSLVSHHMCCSPLRVMTIISRRHKPHTINTTRVSTISLLSPRNRAMQTVATPGIPL